MKTFLIVVVLIVAGIVALGFYRGWLSIGSDSGESVSNVTLTVDRAKFNEDRKTAVTKVQAVGQPAKDKAVESTEK